ncbi:POTRA domain-containing protein [Agrobacterium tumefaciens]|uniref:POTRA domain-containing protein n=1 Tax=Agrobacterium tumefaciens TaxID=358 RepID=UPI003AF89BA5
MRQARYDNRCVGVADITTLLKAITDLYLDKGFGTSRASEWKSKVEPDRVRSSEAGSDAAYS